MIILGGELTAKLLQKMVCLAIVFLLFIGLTQLTVAFSQDDEWRYKKEYEIIGSTSGSLRDYQMRFIVHFGSGTDSEEHVYCDSECKPDFGDIRFTNSRGELLDYWMESKTDGDVAVFWVKIDYIDASPEITSIWIYFGNQEAQSISNGKKTFIFFDDFSGSKLDSGKWENVSQASGQVSIDTVNHWLELTSPVGEDSLAAIKSDPISTGPICVESRRKVVGADWADSHYVGTAICYDYEVPDKFSPEPNYGISGEYDAAIVLREYESFSGSRGVGIEYDFPANTFVNTQLILTSSTAQFSIEGHGVSLSMHKNHTINKNRIVLYAYTWYDADFTCYERVDWVFVRKYAVSPPSKFVYDPIDDYDPVDPSDVSSELFLPDIVFYLPLGLIIVLLAIFLVFKTDILSNFRLNLSEIYTKKDMKSAVKAMGKDIQCIFCGEKLRITEDMQYCRFCGEIIPQCRICGSPIVHGDEILQCPYCKAYAHKTHLIEWIKVKGYCPVCGVDVEESKDFPAELFDQRITSISKKKETISPLDEKNRCSSCEHILTKNVRYCPFCGVRIPQCIICLLPILKGEKFVRCPNCGSFAHRNHLKEWIKVKKGCPYCKEKLNDLDIPS